MAQQTDHIGNTNKMLTAVDWLWNESLKKLLQASDFEQAKAMEKEQIIKAYYKGGCHFHEARDCSGTEVPYENDAENYYNETYGNDTQGKI